MIERAYWLFEITAVLVCLSSLNGKKFRIDIYNAVFISMELLLMQLMQDGLVSRGVFFLVYLLYGIYAYLEFNNNLGRTIIISLVGMMIVGVVQMASYILISLFEDYVTNEDIFVLLINILLLIIIVLTRNLKIYRRVATFCLEKEWLVRICIIICVGIIGYNMYTLKNSSSIFIDTFVVVFVFVVLLGGVLYNWQKTRYDLIIKKKEDEIQNVYNAAFHELIDSVRKRQHDFNNQLDAVYSMHLTTNSYDELVRRQDEYCKQISTNNRYSKVLNCINDFTLVGFVFTKFTKAEQLGVNVEYKINYVGENEFMPVFIIVEIFGILFDNAIEESIENGTKSIEVVLNDNNQGFQMTTKNIVSNLSRSDVAKLFDAPNSSKGKGRGLGLQKIKDYQRTYDFDIIAWLDENKFEIGIEKNK